ncbi:hypothetical protein [Streptomyces soliscabiei]|uniref:hypothetical protein n=1 Tax=Streptomyces soliscabiei TaxID=588897 RepID=UPI0029AC57A1|nr:hypothetical protein [Streptomyces sp. NY05-11A]MDX2683189.1 hypothetical protein [Streptomyces sp. NY05-11A]
MSMTARTAGSSTNPSKQWPPLRTAIRRPASRARFTASTTWSAVCTTYTVSGLPRNRPLKPLLTRSW